MALVTKQELKVWLSNEGKCYFDLLSDSCYLVTQVLGCSTKEYCHRHGFMSEHITGNNKTLQAQAKQGLGPCVLLPTLHPSPWVRTCTKTPFFAIKCCCLVVMGESTESCLHISILCSGLKTNMQTSYLHISMVTLG